MKTTIRKIRIHALLAGFSLLVMALCAGYVFGYAFPKIFDLSDSNLNYNKESVQLYNLMMFGIVIVFILDIVVSFSLYQFFKSYNYKLALWACLLRIIYSIIFGVAIYFILLNSSELNKDIFIKNYLTFQLYWSFGLIVFGFHLVTVGILIKEQKSVHGFLWLLILIVGSAYIIIHSLNSFLPQFKNLISILNSIFSIPMAFAELSLALWLILKGGREITNRNVMAPDKSELFWNRVAKRTSNHNQKPNNKTVKVLKNLKKYLKPTDNVLDFACGSGIIAAEISKEVDSVIGIDISTQMIKVANSRKMEHGIDNLEFSQITIFDESLKSGSFDVILAFNILHYLNNKEAFSNRMNELIKPGGLFISSTVYKKDRKTFIVYLFDIINKLNIMPKIHFYSSNQLEDFMLKYNFKIIESIDISDMPERFIVVQKT